MAKADGEYKPKKVSQVSGSYFMDCVYCMYSVCPAISVCWCILDLVWIFWQMVLVVGVGSLSNFTDN